MTISRVQVELSPRFHPDGGQFMVRDYPKGKKHRRLKLSPQLVAKLTAHAERHSLGPDDLSGCPLSKPPNWESMSGSTICGTPTPRGCSPAVPT